MQKILVLGSNSFSGASFCAHMLKQGHHVIGVSRSEEPIPALLPYSWTDQSNFEFYQLDLNNHFSEITTLIDKEKPKYVYNYAAQSMVGQSWDFPEHWFMTNGVSTVKLHNFLKNKDFLEKYVHISTPEVYGSCNGFVAENTNYNPSTPYAVSRAAADMSLHTFSDVYDFPVVFTRAANVYGEGQQLYRIIPRAVLYIMEKKKLQLHGGGHSERSFIHIDDVSSATQLIGENGKLGDIYHISTPDTISIRNLVEMICQQMDYPFEKLCEISEDRAGKDQAYLLDTTKLKSELGWKHEINLQEGVERVVDWAKNNFDALSQYPHEYIHKP